LKKRPESLVSLDLGVDEAKDDGGEEDALKE